MSIQVKRFGKIATMLGLHEQFLRDHPSRGGNGEGIFFNPAGMFVVYDDGNGFTRNDQIAQLQEQLRKAKNERLTREIGYQGWKARVPTLEADLKPLEQVMDTIGNGKDEYERRKTLDQKIQAMKQEIEAGHNQIAMAEFEFARVDREISTITNLIESISDGSFTI